MQSTTMWPTGQMPAVSTREVNQEMTGQQRRVRRVRVLGVMGAILFAACQDAVSTTPLAPAAVSVGSTAEVNATVAWNKVARELVMQYKTGAPPAIRAYALLSIAQYNAVIAARTTAPVALRPAERAAVAGASAAILTYLYPAEQAMLEAKVDSQELASTIPGQQVRDFAAGEQIGRTVAAAVITRAIGDRFFAPFTGTVPVCAGCWLAVPTPPAFATLGQAKTFFLTSGSQFRPAPPPAFGSPDFQAALAEVRQISDTRTPQQDSIAKFWSLQGGTVTPLGYWNVVASNLIVQHQLDERRAALTLAIMNAAGFDAIIASHEAKYVYWLIRPSQADAQITLPIALPSFPSYPSNHAALSAVAATVLGAYFPTQRQALQSAATEAGVSRIYGGIHYRFDSDAGLAMGRAIGQYVLQRAPVGLTPVPLN